MTRGIEQAIEELRRAPAQTVVAEIDGLVVEMRCRGQRTADDIFEEVGTWEGESAEELREIIRDARVNSEEIPEF